VTEWGWREPGWRRLLEEQIYLGHWATLLIGSLLVAFGFAGIYLLDIARNPLGVASGYLAGAVIGFAVHETAHRYAARRQGCLAGFVLTPMGILLTLLSGVLRSLGAPFVILAPGYVAIYCYSGGWRRFPAREDEIAAAGPASNLVLAMLALIAYHVAGSYAGFLYGFASINAWLALFNLLPLHPLDGYKLFRRNPVTWIILFLAAVFLTF